MLADLAKLLDAFRKSTLVLVLRCPLLLRAARALMAAQARRVAEAAWSRKLSLPYNLCFSCQALSLLVAARKLATA